MLLALDFKPHFPTCVLCWHKTACPLQFMDTQVPSHSHFSKARPRMHIIEMCYYYPVLSNACYQLHQKPKGSELLTVFSAARRPGWANHETHGQIKSEFPNAIYKHGKKPSVRFLQRTHGVCERASQLRVYRSSTSAAQSN